MRSFMRVWLGIALIAVGVGIALLIITFASGVRWEDAYRDAWDEKADFVTVNDTYTGVENMDINIGYGKVNIEKGDEFSISAKNILKGELESYVENGTWHIEENNRDRHSFLGIKFHVRQSIFWGDDFAPKITITVPENFTASDITLKVGAGSVEAEKIAAESGNFSVDAGEMTIKELSVSETSQYSVKTGKMTLSNVAIKDASLDCGVGNMEIDGVVNGDSNIKCGVGNVDLRLNGSEDEYSYDVDCGIGNVSIDGENYNNIHDKVINKENTDNRLKLDCGIGHIAVDFN